MYSVSANRNRKAYDIKKFIVDLTSDIQTLPTNCTAGSTAFVIENSTWYMLNNQKVWVKVQLGSAGGSGDGGSGDGDTVIDVTYDGGVL